MFEQPSCLFCKITGLGYIKSKIYHKYNSGTCDDVMETAWSTMWNVTDETPVNCKRFLDGGGMELFLRCKEVSQLLFVLCLFPENCPLNNYFVFKLQIIS